MLISPRIAGLREHNGEVVGDATRLAIIDRATQPENDSTMAPHIR
jgi:hypothetical protein